MDHPTARIHKSYAHRARAILCEQRAHQALDANSRREWTELAIEWHLLAGEVADDEKPDIESDIEIV
jgi:hypothetical protein